jgi:hypothetical protein
MKKKIEAYVMFDVQKDEPRFCYGTEDKRKGLMAIFFRKVSRPQGWTKEKRVIPCTIIYDTKDLDNPKAQ